VIRTGADALNQLTKDSPEKIFTRWEIVRWWEWHRFAFNVLVGIVGVATWFSVLIFGSMAVKPGVDFEEPMGMIFGPFLWAFLANFCYTSGWLLDVIAYIGKPRYLLFKTGVVFSLVLTALPGLWALVAWLITIVTGQKMD
jgi:hypothetical protein